MRTKNAKRLWPVPVTLGVVAVAALLAFGLMAVTGSQPASADAGDAGHCTDGVEYNHTQNITCTTTGDSLDVKFTGGQDQEGIWVYTTGVSGIASSDITEDVEISGNADDTVDLGEIGIVIAARNALEQIQSEKVTVNRADADDSSQTRLFVFDSSERYGTAADDSNFGDPLALTTSEISSGFTITIIFLGSPAAAVDANDNDSFADADEGDVDGSTIASDLTENEIGPDDATAIITVTMKDANGNLLRGDEDATVDFTATFAMGSDVKRSASMTYSDSEEVSAEGVATFTADGWATGTDSGAVKLTITAAYDGPTGKLQQEIVLSRDGDPAMLEVGTYNCTAAEDPDKTSDGCPVDTKPTADMVFTKGDIFYVIGEFTDALGNVVTVTSPTITASETSALVKAPTAADVPPDGAMAQYSVAENADFDNYTITVSTGTGDNKVELELMVSVSGPATDFELYMPKMNIPAMVGTSQKFSIRATDAKGNIPSDSPMVEVLVLGDAADYYVSGLDDSGMVMIEDGMASFEIFALGGAMDGDTAVILIRVDDMEVDRHTITFGTIKTVPDMPMMVMAEATSHDMITVSWDAVMDATSYMVERGYMDADNMMMWMTVAEMTTDMMYMDSGLMAETTYYYRVTAMNDAGSGDASDGTAMATTMMEEMPPGMPMNVMAEATSHDMITVSWDAVMDATSYMVERGYMDADNMMMWMTVAEMTTDMMYMDSGLMAETTYYYRVTAMNDAGSGDASDGTAMATTMMAPTMMDELGATTGIGVGFNRGGALQVYWTKAANAMGYIIVAIDTADSMVGGDPVVLNDGGVETRNISGLTPGATYDVYVIATGSGGDFELGEPYRVTAQ